MVILLDDLLIKVLPGVIVAIISSLIAVWLSIKRFYLEKWWDRREKSYSEIIDALYHVVQYFRIRKEDYGNGSGYSRDMEIEIYEKYMKSSFALRKATVIGALYISKGAQEILLKLDNRECLDFYSNPSFDVFESEYRYYHDALNRMIDVAKFDLRENHS